LFVSATNLYGEHYEEVLANARKDLKKQVASGNLPPLDCPGMWCHLHVTCVPKELEGLIEKMGVPREKLPNKKVANYLFGIIKTGEAYEVDPVPKSFSDHGKDGIVTGAPKEWLDNPPDDESRWLMRNCPITQVAPELWVFKITEETAEAYRRNHLSRN
jgi:hypothetical protein